MTILRSRITAIAASAALIGAGLLAAAPSASATPAVPACGNNSLAVSYTPSEGATGHASFDLLFRNVSHGTCTLYGYPGLDALNSSGHVLAHAQRTLHGFAGGAPAVKLVTVAPGGYASAVVEWMDFNPVTSGPCAFSKSVATTPANTTHTVHFAISVSACDLQIHPTVAGTSGNTRFAQAQVAWEQGAGASSARQGLYWSQAEAALKLDGAEYSSEVAELKQLISLPDADQTPAQNAAYHRDITALNAFFGTPTLYS